MRVEEDTNMPDITKEVKKIIGGTDACLERVTPVGIDKVDRVEIVLKHGSNHSSGVLILEFIDSYRGREYLYNEVRSIFTALMCMDLKEP